MPDIFDAIAGEQDQAGAQEPVQQQEQEPEQPADPFAAIAQERDAADDAQHGQLKRLYELGVDVAPDRKAGELFIARETGLNPSLVATQYDLFRQRYEAAQFDPKRFRQENPDLAEVLLKNPAAAGVVMRDEQVSGFTKAIRYLSDLGSPIADEGSTAGKVEEAVGGAPFAGAVLTGGRAAARLAGLAPMPERAAGQTATVTSPLADAEGLDRLAIYADQYGVKRKQSALSSLGSQLLLAEIQGRDTYDLERRIIELQQEIGPQRYYKAGPVERVLLDGVEAVGSQVDSLMGGGIGYGLGFGLGALAGGLATRSPSVAGSLGHALGKMGAAGGAYFSSLNQETGGTYLDMRKEKTADGELVDRDIARGASVVYGLLAAGVEVAELGLLAKTFGPLEAAVRAGEGKAFLRSMLADQSKAAIFRDVGKAWAKGTLGEGVEEAVQQTLQTLATWSATSLTAGKAQKFDYARWLTETTESFWKGAVGGAFLAAPGSAVNLSSRLIHFASSERSGATVAHLAGLPASTSAQASPQLVAEIVQRETEKTGQKVENLYVDAGAFVRLFQEQGADIDQAATELLGEDGPAKLKEALAGANAGPDGMGRIEVGLEEYLSKWGRKDVSQALAADTAVRPGLFTERQRLKVKGEMEGALEKRSQQLVAEYEAAAAEGHSPEPEGPGAEHMVEAIQKQFIATGASSPKEARTALATTRAFLETMAEQFGIPADILFEQHATKVEAELASGEQQVPAAAQTQRAIAPEARDARLEAIDVELDSLYAQRVTFHEKQGTEDPGAAARKDIHGRFVNWGSVESLQAARLRAEKFRLEGREFPQASAEQIRAAEDAAMILPVEQGGPASTGMTPNEAAEHALSPDAQGVAERIADALDEPAPTPTSEMVPPPLTQRLFQVQNLPEWELNVRAWMENQGRSAKEIEAHLGAMRGQMKIFSALGPLQLKKLPKGRGKNAGPAWTKNPEKAGTKTTPLPGGPIRENQDDIYQITFDLSAMCVKRLEAAATIAHVQKVLNERAAKRGEPPRALSAGERIALAALFKEAGKTAPCLYCYVEAPRAKAGEFVDLGLKVAFQETPAPSTWADSTRALAFAAMVEVHKLDLKAADIDPNDVLDAAVAETPESQARVARAPAVYAFLRAQVSAAKQNKPKLYEEYVSQILNLSDEQIRELNDFAGFRFFSSSDFQFEHVADLMQAFFDLSLRKARSHAYTKVIEYVEIFGATGQKIQTSIFAKRDAAGNLVEDTWQGMGWEDAKRLRAKYPDVGTVLVATDDEMVRWGLDQPWVDYIIPFHHSGLASDYFSEMGWKDFTSVQTEAWLEPEKHKDADGKTLKVPKIRMHELRAEKGISNEEMTKRYLALAKKRGLRPVFSQFTDHPNFAKLKKDYARSDTPFRAVQPVFDLKAAKRVLDSFFAGDAAKARVDKGLTKKLIEIVDHVDALKKKGIEVDPGVETLRALNENRDIVSTIRRLHQPLFRGVPAKQGEPSNVARFGPAYYYADRRQPAEIFKEHRGEGARVEEKDIDLAGLKMLDDRGLDVRTGTRDEVKQDQFGSEQYQRLLAIIAKDLGITEKNVDARLRSGGLMSIARDYERKQEPAWRAALEERRQVEMKWRREDPQNARQIGWGDERLSPSARAAGEGRSLWPGQPEVARAIREAGFDGLIIANQGYDDVGAHVEYAFFKPPPEKVARLLQAQPTKKAEAKAVRGWVDIVQERLKKVFKVVLTKNQDKSTFLHETGHTMLEMLLDLGERPDAPQRVKEDAARALDWLGAKDRASLTEAQLETWARAWEGYLLEGKAPSPKLVRAFAQFRLWLLEVYRSVAALNVTLDDDIRGVFDRMLATDAEIASMKEAMGVDKPVFRSPEDAGMTPEQFQAYLDDREQSFTKAAATTQRGIFAEQQKALGAWWKEKLEAFRKQAADEYDQRPDVLALAYLKHGKMKLADGRVVSDGQMGRLDRAAVASVIGGRRTSVVKGEKKVTYELPQDLLTLLHGRIVKEGGEHPDDVAHRFGFSSGRELLEAMRAVPERERYADTVAERRMRQAHPEILQEKWKLRELAAAALHNEGTSDWLLKEYAALRARGFQMAMNPETSKMTAVPNDLLGLPAAPIESIRLAAKEIVRKMKAGALNAARALNDERRAAEAAAIAAAKGNFKLAAVEKQKQLLAHEIYRELATARDQREKFEGVAEKLTDRTQRETLARAGRIFVDAADMILEALGFKDPETDPDIVGSRMTMPETMKALEDAGVVPGFSGARLSWLVANPPKTGVTAKGNPVPAWKGMTVEDMRVVGAALVQLYTAARDANTAKLDGKRVEVDTIAAAIAQEATKRPKKPTKPGSDTAAKAGWWARQRLEGMNAALTDPQVILEELGPTAEKFFWDGYLEARNAEYELAVKVSDWFEKHWEDLPPELQARRYDLLNGVEQALPFAADIDRDGTLRDRMWMWMLALNMGNRSNMERLLGGYQWNEKQVRDFLEANMTEEEWTFIESVWELLDKELWPEVAKAYEKVNGLRPEKIENLPFQLQSGRVISGGYFPAKYDPLQSRVGARQDAEALQKMYARPGQLSVMRSFTKERVKEYTDVINLQWSVVPSHVGSVIHYVAHDEFVRDMARVLSHPDVKRAVEQREGIKYYAQLYAWGRAVAVSNNDAIPEELDDMYWPLRWARSGASIAALGYSLTVAIADFSNPLVAMAAGAKGGGVGRQYLTPVLLSALRPGAPGVASGFAKVRAAALTKSKELRERSHNGRMMLRKQLGDIGRGGKKGRVGKLLEGTRETAFVFMEWTDKLVSTVVWEGAYRQAQAQGLSEREAVRAADKTVQKQLPSHATAEQPAILRDKRGFASVMMFYGYFSKLKQVSRRVWRDSYEDWGNAEGAKEKAAVLPTVAGAAGRMLAVYFAANVLGELLSGRGPDEGEEVPEWILRKLLLAPFQKLPLIGSVLEQPVNAGVAHLIHGKAKWRTYSLRASPALSTVERAVRAAEKVVDGKRDTDDRLWAALELAGLGLQTPLGSSQVTRTGRYLTSQFFDDLANGRWDEVVTGPIFGERLNQPANPVTLFTRK